MADRYAGKGWKHYMRGRNNVSMKVKPSCLIDFEQRREKMPAHEPIPDHTIGLDPPELLCDRAQEIWRMHVEMAPPGLLRDADSVVFTEFCNATALYLDASDDFNEGGRKLLIEQPPSGRLVQNPLIEIMNAQAVIINRLAFELGFSPTGRTQIATKIGALVKPTRAEFNHFRDRIRQDNPKRITLPEKPTAIDIDAIVGELSAKPNDTPEVSE